MQLRRLVAVKGKGTLGAYVHGGRIGVLVEMEGGDRRTGQGRRDARRGDEPAVHLAPSRCRPSSSPRKRRSRWRRCRKDSGKPAEILEKIIAGKIAQDSVDEVSLTGQPYVTGHQRSRSRTCSRRPAPKVLGFHRLAVGEGIEKKEEDFAAEVMKQAGLA